jgi:agmatine/peptidylarginine deiminase
MRRIIAIHAILSTFVFSAAFAADALPPTYHLPPDSAAIAAPRPALPAPPPGLEVVNPGEWCPARGVTLAWPGWGQSYLADCARVVAERYPVYLVVRATQQASAAAYLTNAGVNMANVEFVVDDAIDSGAMWMRDYGPFCATDDGPLSIVDFYYGVYDANDHVPLTLATYCGLPYYESAMLHHGGNHISDGNGTVFGSTNFLAYNPGWGPERVAGELHAFLGADSVVIVEPTQGEMTQHIDMYAKMLNDTLFIVAEYENAEDGWPGDKERLDALAAQLDAMQNRDGRDYAVARMPLLPLDTSGSYRVSRTYTNSLIVNELVLVPIYMEPLDAVALQIYRDLMPGYEVVGIDSRFIIEYLGAVHCTTNCIHADNPLMILHEPLTALPVGQAPQVDCRLNPGYASTALTVHYRTLGETAWSSSPATLVGGIFRAQLPAMSEDFEYYLAGQAVTGGQTLPALLPLGAPEDLFSVDVWDATAATAPDGLPLGLAAWPNPFNPATTLRCTLPAAGCVELAVYDALGRRVRVLLDGEALPAGEQRWRFDGRDEDGHALPSGVYLVRLAVGGATRQERLVLLK